MDPVTFAIIELLILAFGLVILAIGWPVDPKKPADRVLCFCGLGLIVLDLILLGFFMKQ